MIGAHCARRRDGKRDHSKLGDCRKQHPVMAGGMTESRPRQSPTRTRQSSDVKITTPCDSRHVADRDAGYTLP